MRALHEADVKYILWLIAAACLASLFWLYTTWHKMDPRQGLARSTHREPTPIRSSFKLHPHVRQEIEEQVGDFA